MRWQWGALALLLAAPAAAEDTASKGVAVDEPGFSFAMSARTEANYAAGADRISAAGGVSVDGPIANVWARPLRLTLDLDITSMAGEAFSPTDVTTFGRAARLSIGTTYRLARGEVGTQRFTTSLYFKAGFTTAFGDELLDRYLRRVEGGVRFAVTLDADRMAVLHLGVCRDEEAGYIGVGQLCASGQLPVAMKGRVFLGGAAVVNLSRASVSRQQDLYRAFAGVRLPEVSR